MHLLNREDQPLARRFRNLPLLVAAAWLLATLHVHAADTTNGQKLYTTHCAACHGNNGVGTMPLTPNFRRGESLLKPDSVLLKSIKNGRGAMPSYKGILKERDIFDVIAYTRTLMQ